MFDDKGGRGGLGKSEFQDKGEGGFRIPQICMTSLKDRPLSKLAIVVKKKFTNLWQQILDKNIVLYSYGQADIKKNSASGRSFSNISASRGLFVNFVTK